MYKQFVDNTIKEFQYNNEEESNSFKVPNILRRSTKEFVFVGYIGATRSTWEAANVLPQCCIGWDDLERLYTPTAKKLSETSEVTMNFTVPPKHVFPKTTTTNIQ